FSYFDSYYFLLALLLWLIFLNKYKRLRKSVVLISLTCSLFFSLYIPSLSDAPLPTSIDISPEPRTITGVITDSVSKKEKSIQFLFQTENPHQKFLTIYFPHSKKNYSIYFIILYTCAICKNTSNYV